MWMDMTMLTVAFFLNESNVSKMSSVSPPKQHMYLLTNCTSQWV